MSITFTKDKFEIYVRIDFPKIYIDEINITQKPKYKTNVSDIPHQISLFFLLNKLYF